MTWLLEPVGAFTYALGREAATTHLQAKLENLGLLVEPTSLRNTVAETVFVARCLTLCLNLRLWRCWSDKLEFKLTEVGSSQTRVTVRAIPNLLRRGPRGERVTDVARMVASLQSD